MTTNPDQSTDDDEELLVVDGLPEETLVRLAKALRVNVRELLE